MKSLLRAVPNASHVCASCRRTFTSIAPRRQDHLAELNSLLSGRAPTPSQAPPKPTATLTEPPPSRSPSQSSSKLFKSMRNAVQKAQAQTPAEPEQLNMGTALGGALSGMSQSEAVEQVERQQHRRWVSGDVYSVHDLGPREGQKWAELKRRPQRDVFEMIGEDPRRHYKNMPLLSQFVTETGRIKHSKLTGLKPKNQRKLAKAVRRAIGTGLMPSVHKHPQVIAKSLGIDDHLTPPRYS